MINKYFYLLFDKELKPLEVATCIDYPGPIDGGGYSVVFNMNVFNKEQMLASMTTDEESLLPQELRAQVRTAIKLFF